MNIVINSDKPPTVGDLKKMVNALLASYEGLEGAKAGHLAYNLGCSPATIVRFIGKDSVSSISFHIGIGIMFLYKGLK